MLEEYLKNFINPVDFVWKNFQQIHRLVVLFQKTNELIKKTTTTVTIMNEKYEY